MDRPVSAAAATLGALYAGRPVVLGPGPLAAWTTWVARLRALGCPVLVVATGRGAGPVPPEGSCTVVEVTPAPAAWITDELRRHDRLVRTLPDPVRAAIDAFDPDRRGCWVTTPFVTSDAPIDDRPVTGGRPASYLALEDKVLADGIWAAAGVEHAPYRVHRVDDPDLDASTDELSGPLGAVWTGDARDGFNGGGDYVRWVGDARDRAAARAFFAVRCDRVRVLPFLDGVPCSVHGMVLPDGTAAFRPVEIAVLREPARRRLVYGGLGTWWDPPPADREAMRDAVRRVGAHLAAEHAYRGAFGIDGVLTDAGFRPTELNTRMSAGLSLLSAVDRDLFALLQATLVAGGDPGLRVADLEALVPAMDRERRGHLVALAAGAKVGGQVTVPVGWDGRSLGPGSDSSLVASDSPTGFFATLDPCPVPGPDGRVAAVQAALLAHLDTTYGSDFGPLAPAPDLRTA